MTRFNVRNAYMHTHICKRSFQSKCYASKENLSGNVRQKFLDFFIKENKHNFVRSSPVKPYCDPSVAFVNAGMNQFKSLFLGQQDPIYNRVANSQKCVRVGGKHNDLDIVGTDGYHHTFFEMLGNWSFNDYFKKEACEMAWNLLTGPYGLKPSSLYVTYFGGNPKMNLEPDLECREIWRSMGIADDHILAFGANENFWEMGPSGPCGPCTEIHIDHTNKGNRSRDVNKNLADLTELWNIVFIQYNRNVDGSIELLPKHHIDTGMGLERLTAILQGKQSNYDTDIFSDLFQTIYKKCKGIPKYEGKLLLNDINGIDSAYRILADHSRMITACLSDGIIPEENQKLRRIIRKVMLLSETVFKQDKGLLNELAKIVAQNLGSVYPEMEKKINQVQEIISYEEEVYKSIRSTATKEWFKILEKEPKLKNLNFLEMPGLVSAYNELASSNTKCISAQLAFKLYDTYGLNESTIGCLADALHFQFNSNDLKEELRVARLKTREGFLLNEHLNYVMQQLLKDEVTKTDDSFKYSYTLKDNKYQFDVVDCHILRIINSDYNVVSEIEANTTCYLLLNKTNCYSEAGGQVSDRAHIQFAEKKYFDIIDTQNMNGYILHKGVLTSNGKTLQAGDCGKIFINEKYRLGNMLNHTATHLINAALKAVVSESTCQKSSKVTPDYLNLDVGVYNRKLSIDDIKNIEELVSSTIRKSLAVQIKQINSQEFFTLDNVTLMPGEIYPDIGIRLVQIGLDGNYFSCEPCCGTHVLNTSSIKDVCITNYKSLGRSTLSLTAITGQSAMKAHKNGKELLHEIADIENNLNNPSEEFNVIDAVTALKQKLNKNLETEFMLPVYVRINSINVLNSINKQIRNVERDFLKQFIDLEMQSILESNNNKSNNNTPYIVHFLGCSSIIDNIPLQRATKICSNLPVLVLSYSDEIVKARCCVPQKLVNSQFNAELWLKNTVGQICKSPSVAPKGQDAAFVCNMKSKRINKLEWELVLKESIKAAENYAKQHL